MEKKKLNLENAHVEMWDVCYNCMACGSNGGDWPPPSFQTAMIAAIQAPSRN